jgi:hypothetical protein
MSEEPKIQKQKQKQKQKEINYRERDFAVLSMMGATDEQLAGFMTPEDIAEFRAWEEKHA